MKFVTYLWNVLFPSPPVDRVAPLRSALKTAGAHNRAAFANLEATIEEVLQDNEAYRSERR